MKFEKPKTRKEWKDLQVWYDQNKEIVPLPVLADRLGMSYGYVSAFLTYARHDWPEKYRSSWGFLLAAEAETMTNGGRVVRRGSGGRRPFSENNRRLKTRLWRKAQVYTQAEWAQITKVYNELTQEFGMFRSRRGKTAGRGGSPRQVLIKVLGVHPGTFASNTWAHRHPRLHKLHRHRRAIMAQKAKEQTA